MVYLDHAASTPMLPEAVAAMTAELGTVGNASSLHAAGRRARRTVEESRERVAQAVGARPSEVLFTSGGTESDNVAVKGLFWARRAADPARRRILASAVEHHAVLDTVEWLRDHDGATVSWLPVDAAGRVDPETLRGELADGGAADVALVTVMWANNEIGTVQPVAELTKIAHDHDVPVHTDAVQAVGSLPVDFTDAGLDALTFTGHKLGGPLGVGALVLGRGVECTPLLHGGGQEREVRSGTLDVPAIAGFAAATEQAVVTREERARRVSALRDDALTRVCEIVPDALVNGPGLDLVDRLPGNAHVSFPGCEGDSLLLLLDARGIECSTGSACSAGVARPSHVLLALGHDEERARGSLRFSLGHTSTAADVSALAAVIGPVIERARRAGVTGARPR